MIPVNKDTILLVATIVCAIGIIFLFKELNKAKEDIDSFKNFSSHLVTRLNSPVVESKPIKITEESEECKNEKSEE